MSEPELAYEASELLVGSARKVAVARYHARELARVLEDASPYEIALQAHFEGVLYAGIAAEEKLTQALCMLTDNDCGADTNRLVVALRRREVTAELGRRLGRWLVGREGGKTLAEEARALRNAATHRFYDKRGSPRGEWHYEVDTGRGQFRDGLVLEFASAYARHLDELRAIAEVVAERWELRLERLPVEA